MFTSDRRAQVSVEYLALFGTLLIIIAALASYSFFVYNDTIANNHLQSAIKDLQLAANKVYALGEGN